MIFAAIPKKKLTARRWQLSVYDAAYLQLALANKAALVTLDARLAQAWDDAQAATGNKS